MSKRVLVLLAFVALVVFGVVPPSFAAGNERVLYRFRHRGGGILPEGGVIFDAAANLYGTTCGDIGFDKGYGTVFELTPGSGGTWSETVLHDFGTYVCPYGGLVFDAAGNLYGTTIWGGKYSNGIAFELAPNLDGTWNETILHEFGGPGDGSSPNGDLIFDAAGNLYGTTYYGGTAIKECQENGIGCGTVFELIPSQTGQWTEKVLHNFHRNGTDGVWPSAGLAMDAAGNLYGPAALGGPAGFGVVFELSPNAHGKWSETILFSFDGNDGAGPAAKLVFGPDGNLYGTTLYGGESNGFGTVFELIPGKNGQWSEKLVRTFFHNGRDPDGPVIFDSAGNLYVTTTEGGRYGGGSCGSSSCGGSLFKLSPDTNGKWTMTDLHDFNGKKDGSDPTGALIFDSTGNLYGTTVLGGDSESCVSDGPPHTGCGVVFEITP